MIVKVQRSLFNSEGVDTMLVYNEDRSIMYEAPTTDDIKKLLGDRPKAYFKAKLKGTLVHIESETKPQNW